MRGRHRLGALLDRAHGLCSSRIFAALRSAYPSMFRCVVLAHGQRPLGHVVLDHRAGASVGGVADFYRRDQHRVNADADVVADHRPVLAETVVVGGDRAGAEVAAGADLGVADVGEVRAPWRPRRSASS